MKLLWLVRSSKLILQSSTCSPLVFYLQRLLVVRTTFSVLQTHRFALHRRRFATVKNWTLCQAFSSQLIIFGSWIVLSRAGKKDCPQGEDEFCPSNCGVPSVVRTNLKPAMSGKISGGEEASFIIRRFWWKFEEWYIFILTFLLNEGCARQLALAGSGDRPAWKRSNMWRNYCRFSPQLCFSVPYISVCWQLICVGLNCDILYLLVFRSVINGY